MKIPENVKVGDKIWTIQDGWTEVRGIDLSLEYAITAGGNFYNLYGCRCLTDKYPSAFLTNPFEQQGKWMEVSDDKEDWVKRFVIFQKNNGFIAISMANNDEDLKGEYNTIFCKYAREIEQPKEIELTMNDIAEKFGIDVSLLKIKK